MNYCDLLIKYNLKDARGANLSHEILKGINLCNVNLNGANLSYADLRNAFLIRTDCGNANFTGCDLRSANLKSSCLHYANFTDAFLQNSDFSGASLFKACFKDADLTGANFQGASIDLLQAGNGKELRVANIHPYQIAYCSTTRQVAIGYRQFSSDEWLGFGRLEINQLLGIDFDWWQENQSKLVELGFLETEDS